MILTPTLCKTTKDDSGADVAPLFTGAVSVKVPSMPQSYRIKAKYGKRTMAMQDATKEKSEQAFVMMELLADMAEDIAQYIDGVDLVEIATKKEIKSVDELYSYEPAFPIISEIAMKFIQGFAEKE